jgi:acetamidase/formamidase
MTGYRLDATPATTSQVFSRELAPVLTVEPGDTVTLRSLDAGGRLERQHVPGQDVPTMFAEWAVTA